jgi:hypothetical protein
MGAFIVFSQRVREPEAGGSGVMRRAMGLLGRGEFGIVVQEDASTVVEALSNGWARFTRVSDLSTVYVNPTSVLYVEDYEPPKSEAERRAEAQGQD